VEHWDGYSSFYLAFVYFLCDIVQCVVCLSHTVFHFVEGIWLGFILILSGWTRLSN